MWEPYTNTQHSLQWSTTTNVQEICGKIYEGIMSSLRPKNVFNGLLRISGNSEMYADF